MKKLAAMLLAAALVGLATPAAMATNGMNMIGTNAVSSGMGGADMAVPAGCTAVAGNPAQLAQTCNRVVSFGGSFLMPFMKVRLGGGPSTDNEFQLFPLPFVGYAQRIGVSRWSIGVGIFAQGGMGVDFQNVQAGPGVRDELFSEVAFLRLAPTVAYNVSDRLTLGASLFIGYATLEYKFFPNLPMGQEVNDLSSTTFAGRVGLSYQINKQWTVGLTYTSKSTIDFKDGELIQNFGPPLGKVTYRNAVMDDFTWPQQVEAGVAFRPVEKLIIAFDITWIDWSSAIENVTVRASNPAGPVPPGFTTLTVPFALQWRDQYVFAIGLQYEVTPKFFVRVGYNYGRNPVPSSNLSPLFPAITEHHATVGCSFKLGSWDLDFAYEHAFDNKDTNDGALSALNPFAGSEVSHYQHIIHFMISYRF